MRLLLKLRLFKNTSLTANYNYPLSASIYQSLQLGSPEFSSFLHEFGFNLNGKKYKLFSFALRFEKMKFVDGEIKLLNPNAHLYVSSPLIDDFIQNFVIGTFEKQKIEIAASGKKTIFEITQVESLPEIEIKNEMHFKLLSPIVLSTKRQHNGILKQYFLRPGDTPEINRILTQNLRNKYRLIHNKEINTDDLILEWDKNYIEKKKRVTKKISIYKNGGNPIDIIGILAPFTLKGNPELIKIGYDCGFGEKNSLGFGMADTG